MGAMLRITADGLQTSIQDRGRIGYGRHGVPRSGAADSVALRLGNALVGNYAYEPVIEFRVKGPTIEAVGGPARIGLAGDMAARVLPAGGDDPRTCEAWQSVLLMPGDRLETGTLKSAGTGYLAVGGGLALNAVLGSCSTYVRAGLGGLGDGVLLSKDDELPLRSVARTDVLEKILLRPPTTTSTELRVMPGPQDDYFDDAALRSFQSQTFRVTQAIDRMGARLVAETAILARPEKGHDIVSDGLVPGAIQVPGDGMPIILGVDCQTTGGYPKIATVITADLHRLGQLLPDADVCFRCVTRKEASSALQALETNVKASIASITDHRSGHWMNLKALYTTNLVSGIVDAKD